jgi:hypothetical protein
METGKKMESTIITESRSSDSSDAKVGTRTLAWGSIAARNNIIRNAVAGLDVPRFLFERFVWRLLCFEGAKA